MPRLEKRRDRRNYVKNRQDDVIVLIKTLINQIAKVALIKLRNYIRNSLRNSAENDARGRRLN